MMKFASKYTYFNQRQKEPEGGEEASKKQKILRKEKKMVIDEDELFKTDVNVMSIGFAFLKEAQKSMMGTGDAAFCSVCKAALNSFSKLMSKDEYLMKVQGVKNDKNKMEIEEEEEKKGEDNKKLEASGKIQQDFAELKPNEKVWICEFCEKQNKFMLEEEEIPKKNDMIYIIESKNQGLLIFNLPSFFK